MLAARLVIGGLAGSHVLRCSYARVTPLAKPNSLKNISWRQFSDDAKQARTWGRRRRSLKEIAMQPAGETCEYYIDLI